MKSKQKYPFLKVGVTGGIGSGKSTVCGLFADLGRHVIMADDVARKLADENGDIREAIQRAFGPDTYLSDGLLNRKKVASIVFNDPKKRSTLDSIIHPYVFEAIDLQLQTISPNQESPYVLIEAALMYETRMDEALDYVVVVSAEEETCIQRVTTRDQLSRNDVLQRIAAQMPMPKKLKKADFVLHNNASVDDLRSTIKFLDTVLSQLKPARPS
jgi:dephospho-CoA kinase